MAQSQAPNREFHFEKKDFDFIVAFIKERAGISLAANKQQMVYGRLSRRLRALKMSSFGEYCEFISSPQGNDELFLFLNALTTNLTRFFREAHHFEHLASTVIPGKIQQARAGAARRIRIWSAGSSTGEEPYSTAMVLLGALNDITLWDARILATDIDTNVLKTCREGVYDTEKIKDVPKELRRRFIKPLAADSGKVRMSEALRSLIVFKSLNLHGRWPMKGPFDVIFCRNVIIYFDKPTQQKLIDRFADILSDDGFLYVGHSENLFNITKRFRLIGKSVYKKA